MTPVRSRVLAAVLLCLAWLVMSTMYAADARAADPAVDLGGSELPGGEASTDPADPVELTPGLWADELGPGSSAQGTHHFRYERAIQDSTVHIGAIGASRDRETADGLEIEVSAEDETCGSESASGSFTAYQAVFGPGLAIGPREPADRNSVCLTSPTLDIVVSRGSSSSSEDLPIAIKVFEEAPVTGAGSLPEPDEDASAEPVSSSADPEELDGATDFATAPLLDADPDGVVIDTAVTEGEQRLWRVPVAWGQQLAVTARIPAQDGDESLLSAPNVQLQVVEPARGVFSELVDDAESTGPYDPEDSTQIWDASPPVDYLNRYAYSNAATPGDYWVAVSVTPGPDDRDAVDVPVELTVAVEGDESGVPTYPETVTAPGGESGPDGYHPDTPYLVAEDEFAAVPSGDGDSGFWGVRRWSGVGLGLLSLSLLGAGVWRLLARRP